MTPEKIPDLISKEVAGRMLGLSPRRALELATSEKKMRFREVRNAQTGMNQKLLYRVDVERQAAERRTVPAPWGAESAVAPQLALRAPVAAHTEPLPWMTLEDAEQHCGLSRRLLLRLIHAGELPALEDQPIKVNGKARARRGSSWRVCRRDLESIRGHTGGKSAATEN